jgi:hypothetical protein
VPPFSAKVRCCPAIAYHTTEVEIDISLVYNSVEEFEQVFSDVFLRDSGFYKKILEILCAGAKEMPAIKRLLTGNQHGRVSEYLRELELAGFVTRDHT